MSLNGHDNMRMKINNNMFYLTKETCHWWAVSERASASSRTYLAGRLCFGLRVVSWCTLEKEDKYLFSKTLANSFLTNLNFGTLRGQKIILPPRHLHE